MKLPTNITKYQKMKEQFITFLMTSNSMNGWFLNDDGFYVQHSIPVIKEFWIRPETVRPPPDKDDGR